MTLDGADSGSSTAATPRDVSHANWDTVKTAGLSVPQ